MTTLHVTSPSRFLFLILKIAGFLLGVMAFGFWAVHATGKTFTSAIPLTVTGLLVLAGAGLVVKLRTSGDGISWPLLVLLLFSIAGFSISFLATALFAVLG